MHEKNSSLSKKYSKTIGDGKAVNERAILNECAGDCYESA